MKLLHTSDWHLGRALAGERLIGDQAFVLDRLVQAAKAFRPDALLIAGDVYDRAVPPPEAVELLDQTLSDIVLGLGIPVVLIAGNHDSACRLGFASRLLAEKRLYVIAEYSANCTVLFDDPWGPVAVCALPYTDLATARDRLTRPDLPDHDAAMRAIVERFVQPGQARCVIAAHAFVEGGQASDSERPLSVGGAATVSCECFGTSAYVALGHLHRAQQVGREQVQYSGSILKYSFAEADHTKSLNLVEIGRDGTCTVTREPLRPRRNVRNVEGFFADVHKGNLDGVAREDLVHVTLLDTAPVLEPAARLREVYPYVLEVAQPACALAAGSAVGCANHEELSEADLFASFYSQVNGEEMTEGERAELLSVLEELAREEREA